MVASIRKFGFKIPVLARSSGEMVDGHLRLKAARKLGMPDQDPRDLQWAAKCVKNFF
jgi:ParB-like chromosome segregation protein Spo0J